MAAINPHLGRKPHKGDILILRRFPAAKTFRPHLLGLSAGLTLTLAVFTLMLPVAFFSAAIVVALFLIGTVYLGSLMPLIAAALAFIPGLAAAQPTGYLAYAFFSGYLAGVTLALSYNAAVFLYITNFEKQRIKIAFAVDRRRSVNIIKSPIEQEEKALLSVIRPVAYYLEAIDTPDQREQATDVLLNMITRAYAKLAVRDQEHLLGLKDKSSEDERRAALQNLLHQLKENFTSQDAATRARATELFRHRIEPLVERVLKLNRNKLYNMPVHPAPEAPYTILFVANPVIKKEHGEGYEADPIMTDPRLFYRTVEKALRAFAGNEIYGRPEIWSRIRIVTVFDTNLAGSRTAEHALVGEYGRSLLIDDIAAAGMLTPLTEMETRVQAMLARDNSTSLSLRDIDVIIALSASATHLRASSRYADYLEGTPIDTEPGSPLANGCAPDGANAYTFDPDPNQSKQRNGEAEIRLPWQGDSGRLFEHELYSSHPGRCAINVYNASKRTFVHEFTHAMSSALRGAICDEYADRIQLIGENGSNGNGRHEEPVLPFYINRIERTAHEDGTFTPVHTIFGRYNCTEYRSDLFHPSAKENWLGYFPEKRDPAYTCTMDRPSGMHRFDKLLADFIYDRLCAKLNRPARTS
ncbi:MAG TPA: hypothetical protein ENJ29_14790 [Bacteroidetes bacterium]|nr:hypothetical protein [Bacteroidota bacterium]